MSEKPVKMNPKLFNAVCTDIVAITSPLRFHDVEIRISSVHLSKDMQNGVTPEHQHPDYELSFCEVGEFTTYCDNENVVCTENNDTVFFMCPSTLHNRTFRKDGRTFLLAFVFSVSALTRTGRRICSVLPEEIRRHRFQYELNAEQRELYRQIIQTIESDSPLKLILGQQLFCIFLTRFFSDNFSGLFSPRKNSVPNSERNIAGKIQWLIINRLNRTPVSLQELEKLYHLGSRQLTRLFLKKYGETIIGFQQKMRLDNVDSLLSGTELPITEIAHSLGFKSLVRFTNFYRFHRGESPSSYRKRTRR